MKKSKAFWRSLKLSLLSSVLIYAINYSFIENKWWEYEYGDFIHLIGSSISFAFFFIVVSLIVLLIVKAWIYLYDKIIIQIKLFNKWIDS